LSPTEGTIKVKTNHMRAVKTTDSEKLLGGICVICEKPFVYYKREGVHKTHKGVCHEIYMKQLRLEESDRLYQKTHKKKK